MSKEIEKVCNVEKCLILRLAGKMMTDGRDYKIPCDETFFEDILDDHKPIIVNDITKDKNLQKDLHKNFKLKVMNLMYIPVIQKK